MHKIRRLVNVPKSTITILSALSGVSHKVIEI